jgi:hypothetical protein
MIVIVCNNVVNHYNTNTSKQIHFLLCESCLWCASYLRENGGSTISKCPACNSGRIESIPIFHSDIYRLYYDPKRGVTLESLSHD